MDTLLSSTIIWYTFTNKLLTVSTIIITEDVIETINTGDTSEYFIDKSELNYFVDAVTLLTTGSLDDVSVDATTVVNNINTIVLSSIVRNIVTDNIISSSNEIVIKDSNSNIYATVNAKYDSTGKTSTYVCQATSSELTYFVEAVKIVLGDSPSSFDIDYSSIDVKTIDSSILYSTIILIGLQSTITTAINVYNVYALSNGLDQFEPTYSSYYLYDSTASDVNYMAKNNNIVNKLEVERLQEAYSAI